MATGFRWLKGHGTENDFVLLPDPDGTVHGPLDPTLVRAVCHRRRGVGADGVLRVVRSAALDDPAAREAVEAGAWGFAVVRAVLDAEDPETAAREIRSYLETREGSVRRPH